MRRIWRLFHVFIIALVYTAYASLVMRFRPVAERPLLRARHQQVGTGMVLRAMGVRASMRGAPPVGKPMLFVSNHMGLLDPLVLSSQMPLSIVGKAELGRWPFIGWLCRTYGLLFVDRGRRTSTSIFVKQVQKKLHEGVSVLVFPEGITNWGDSVHPFKTGAFQAVAGRDEAVLPLFVNVLAVNGEPTQDGPLPDISHCDRTFVEHCWHLLSLKRVDMEVCVGEPVATTGRDRKELARLTHRVVSGLGSRFPAELDGR